MTDTREQCPRCGSHDTDYVERVFPSGYHSLYCNGCGMFFLTDSLVTDEPCEEED